MQFSQQIGRILAANSRASRSFSFSISLIEDEGRSSGLAVEVNENAEWSDIIAGCYLLRSNVAGWSDEELWQTYIQLSDAESAFRIQESELSIRPVWHQREDRAKAHILVCFLAYALWKTLELWQQQAGLGNSPGAILEELRQVQSADVVLPTTDGRECRVRCVVTPNEAQAHLLDRLGIQLPKRLSIPAPLRTEAV